MEPSILQCDAVVIGAGVVGLSVAVALPKDWTTIVVEAYPKFGQETSSRNSEVVHSGIYYPLTSEKTRCCIAGRMRLYAFCEEAQVPYAKTGKILVATSQEEEGYVERLISHCEQVDVPYRRLNKAEINSREPLVHAQSGVLFPESGIVDSHALMAVLEQRLLNRGTTLAYHTRVEKVLHSSNVWRVKAQTGGESFHIESPIVINCAGLGAAEISNLALGTSKYEHRWCRGKYFSLSSKFNRKFKHLIYPVPPKDGLGVHVTMDMGGTARLGPDVEWCEQVAYTETGKFYDCDWETVAPSFLAAVHRYCPGVELEDLIPSQIGIRPKLFIDGKAYPDFLVENHAGFLHCLGIESPGLTSALVLGDQVVQLLRS